MNLRDNLQFVMILVILPLYGSTWAAESLDQYQWTVPVPLTLVNSASAEECSPFLSLDGLTLYFARVSSETFYYGRILQATRPQPFGLFTKVRQIDGPLNSSRGHNLMPWVSPDNLRMYYYNEFGGRSMLRVSRRGSVNAPWPEGTSIVELNALGQHLQAPKLTSDELIIFFEALDIPGGKGGYDIWKASRLNSNSPFSGHENLSEINTIANEGAPSVSADGLTLVFHSNRNGPFQLFRATRGSLAEPFGNVEHLLFADTAGGHSMHPYLTSDGSTLYFVSQVGEDRTTRDICVSFRFTRPTVYYVDVAHGSDFNNGFSPQVAFAAIQKGIDSSQNGDEVIVYPATYHENIHFKGKNITLTSKDANNPDIVAKTVINGSQNGSVVTFNNGESADCILAGFTITDGRNDLGGGIFASSASPTVTNCVLIGNTANLGGAIYCSDNSDLSLQNCTINKNSAGFGGAIYCLLSSPKLSDCIFSMNQGTWRGGAVFNDKAAPTLSSCIFNDNSTNGNGGGMFNEASSSKLSNCAFGGNSARTGGAIYCEPGCELIITDGKIAQNHADYGGGIYVSKCVNAKVTNCSIVQNLAILGAGIYSVDTALTIKQCVFYENTAQYGGAVFCDAQPDGRLTMINCTLAGNSAVLGRSIACDSFLGNSSVTLINSILYNGGNEILNNDNSNFVITYSDIQGGWPGKSNIDVYPAFVDLVGGDYYLLQGSPCIDAGDPQYLPEPNETDFSSQPRLVGEAIDLGAYETQPAIEIPFRSFEFEATIGFPDLAGEIIIIRNSGAGTLNWQISYDCSWLAVDPNTGSSQGQENTAYLRVNSTDLSEGQYHCQLTVSAPLALNSPQTVQVTLTVHKNCFPDTPQYAQQYTDFLEYAAAGADPGCWCASWSDGTHYQCDGDASGRKQTFTNYRVFTDDLALIIKNWKKKIDTADPCADIDHKAQLFQKYRVFTNDLCMLITNWKKRDDQLANNCPRQDGK
jgi:predicted outer membrane repeat protein